MPMSLTYELTRQSSYRIHWCLGLSLSTGAWLLLLIGQLLKPLPWGICVGVRSKPNIPSSLTALYATASEHHACRFIINQQRH